MTSVEKIVAKLGATSEIEKDLIRRAYDVAARAHEGHTRFSSEPYIEHVASVAEMLADMGMGPRTITAALLHDTLEDTKLTVEDIRREFGDEILFLVEGVTKLGSARYYGSDRHNESLRKLFVATSQDIRVLIIKLVDRLHNMQTLQFVPKNKQLRIARETLEIYVAVAHRLGMGRIRKELEDLAFPYVYPKEYEQVVKLTKPLEKRSQEALEKARKSLRKHLAEAGVKNFHTYSRVKGLYSLFQKLKRKDWDMDKIYDYLAIRVVVSSVEECYRTLGIVHEIWRPMPKRVKDYIAFPKPNGYHSLHTTVITPQRTILEMQIRTEKMHRESEFGIASHIIYKDTATQKRKVSAASQRAWFTSLIPQLFRPFAWRQKASPVATSDDVVATVPSHKERMPHWIQEIGESHRAVAGATEFVDELRSDFFTHRIFVFTPEGDVVDLPVGACPIDFAYAIHSEVGDHIAGAKVNNKLVGLDTELTNGNVVEIFTKKSNHPTPKWLDCVKTSLAKRRIRNALALQESKMK